MYFCGAALRAFGFYAVLPGVCLLRTTPLEIRIHPFPSHRAPLFSHVFPGFILIRSCLHLHCVEFYVPMCVSASKHRHELTHRNPMTVFQVHMDERTHTQ